MQRDDEEVRSHASSRRSSVSLPRKLSLKHKDARSPAAPSSAQSTPKRAPRPSLDVNLLVTGTQIRRSDRANSLPGNYRHQTEGAGSRTDARRAERTRMSELGVRDVAEKKNESQSSSQVMSFEDEMSLDLSQVSDFEDTNWQHGVKKKFAAIATSTPKPTQYSPKSAQNSPKLANLPPKSNQTKNSQFTPKPRSASLQSHMQQRVDLATRRSQQSIDSSRSRYSDSVTKRQQSVDSRKSQQSLDSSRKSQQSLDSSRKSQQSIDFARRQQSVMSSESTFSYSKDSPYKTSSSASPFRYTGDSSLSPEGSISSSCAPSDPSPLLSSWCASWQECETVRRGGEWAHFWAAYSRAYDQCPTPYHQHAECPSVPESGLTLTAAEGRLLAGCARTLVELLAAASDRQTGQDEVDHKKKNLTLDLKASVVEAVRACETATTQTDISLPNTRSAPRILERILRQLSCASDEPKRAGSEAKQAGSDANDSKERIAPEQGNDKQDGSDAGKDTIEGISVTQDGITRKQGASETKHAEKEVEQDGNRVKRDGSSRNQDGKLDGSNDDRGKFSGKHNLIEKKSGGRDEQNSFGVKNSMKLCEANDEGTRGGIKHGGNDNSEGKPDGNGIGQVEN